MQIIIKSNKFEFATLKVTLNYSVMVVGIHTSLELTYNMNWDFLRVILHIMFLISCSAYREGGGGEKPSRRICKVSQETMQ